MSNALERVVITGAGGMLAAALVRALRARGRGPVTFGRAALDITNADAVMDAVKKHHPSHIINCAAYTKVDLCEQETALANAVNGTGPANLAAAAKECGAQLVHFSTDFVFDGQATEPYRTDATTNPLSAYGKSKLMGEEAIKRFGDGRAIIIRTAWLYGPGGPSFPKTMLDVARAGKPLRVVNDQVGSPTYTDDLAAATLDLIEKDAHGIYHVTNSGQTTWFDFAKAIFEEFGLSPDLKSITSAEWKATKPQSAHRPAYSVLDMSDFERITGRKMRPWREGLRAFHAACGGV